MSVAILVDAAFFIKRFPAIYPKLDKSNPEVVGKTLYSMCMEHVKREDLYRILVYDCKPLNKKSAHPLNGNPVDFSKIPGVRFPPWQSPTRIWQMKAVPYLLSTVRLREGGQHFDN